MIYNSSTKTFPLAFHFPGKHKHNLFDKVKKIKNYIDRCEDLEILTWNTYKEKSLLENYCYCTVLGCGFKNWNNTDKIVCCCDHIDNISTNYIIGFDGFDVIPIDVEGIVRRFEKMNCEMLFSSDKVYFPCGFDKITKNWKEFQIKTSDGVYNFLNGGAWIAKSDFFKTFFRECLSKIQIIKKLVLENKLPSIMPPFNINNVTFVPKKPPYLSEQMILNCVYKEFYPRVKIDNNCEIFQTLNNQENNVDFLIKLL